MKFHCMVLRLLVLFATAFATSTQAAAPCKFRAAAAIPAGTRPSSMAIADLNRDGKPDLAVTQRLSPTILIFAGTGNGSFAPPVSVSRTNIGQPITTGDFNGDGKQDLAVSDWTFNAVSILLGNGDLTFAAPVAFNVGLTPNSIQTGDFDRDGTPDLATANVNSDSVSLLLGKGDGTFSPATNFVTGKNPQQIAIADFDRNGMLDIAAVNRGAGSVSILLGNGAGSFAAASTYAAGSASSLPYSLAVDDFNRDGIPDLAVPLEPRRTLAILLGNGDGTFATAVPWLTGNFSGSVVTSDFDGDGKPDVAVDGDDVAILYGAGDGKFGVATHLGRSTDFLAIADLDRNGQRDLVGVNEFANEIFFMPISCARRRSADH